MVIIFGQLFSFCDLLDPLSFVGEGFKCQPSIPNQGHLSKALFTVAEDANASAVADKLPGTVRVVSRATAADFESEWDAVVVHWALLLDRNELLAI